ncbi:MAG TPA: type I-U CRISPR-associated protein Csb2, partial [Bryobacteraceae bacterium]
VSYLLGRVYSARFEDGDLKDEPEWPPHPSRLFSALTSAWGEGGAEEELRDALEWLERQPAPRILAGTYTVRRLLQAFVPINDEVSKQRDTILKEKKQFPEERPRKGRVFPSATLTYPDVYFIWDAQPEAGIRDRLDCILQRTSSLGHSSSLISVEMAAPPDTGELTEWHPNASRGDRMRIPYPGRLRELVERHKLFEEDGSKVHRPSAGRSTLYAPPKETKVEPVRSLFDRMIVLRHDSGQRASLRSTLSVMAALRGAILKHSPQPPPEYISGHSPGSTAEVPVRSERPHIALAPLPFVGAPHASGELKGVAVLLPSTLNRIEREICWRAVEAVEKLEMPWGWWDVSVADAEEHLKALQPQIWCKAHTVWSTVTPFVFDRYPKEPFGDEAERTVREAMTRVGLPEPCEVDLHYNPWHLGVPKASAFPPAPARPGKPQRYHCHARVRFDRLVAGPVVAGAGRYYGYGLFRALDDGDKK